MKNKEEEKLPVLIFLLNNCKFHQIIKILLNRQVSRSILQQYGQQETLLTSSQQFKINKAIGRFSIVQVLIIIIRKQLIQLKGSTQTNIKQYQSTILLEMIKRKLIPQFLDVQTRKYLWIQLSQHFTKKDLYQDLKLLDISPDFKVIIEKDIRRTSKPENIKLQAKQVLQYFAQYNPYIGYCQGMNNIIAFILSQNFTCSQAFTIFKKITQEILPCDYYTNLDNIMAYIRIFYQGLSIVHPQIYHHLKKISIQFQNSYAVMLSFVMQWFVCLYCNDNICQQITLLIWDFFLTQGIVVLFKAGFAIFDLLKPYILACNDFQSYNKMQKDIIKTIKDTKFIKRRILQIYLSPKILFLLKQKLVQPKAVFQLKQQKIAKKESFEKNCDRKSNVCFQVLQNNMEQNKPYEVFVFKTNAQIKIIPNYMETLHKQYFKLQKQKSKVDSLMIGRISHTCRNSSDTITQGSMSDKNQGSANKITKKSLQSTPKHNRTPSKTTQQQVRDKVSQKISSLIEKKPQISRSQSIIFMQQMVKNVSISHLLQFYDIDELFE